tara:strand:+ start:9372 stop:10199 length:828 start_codon:yes stop_codon:yes gene_type:complete
MEGVYLDKSKSLQYLKNSIQRDFLSFDAYMSLSSTMESDSSFSKKDIYKYDRVKELQVTLKQSLDNRVDKDELLGLSAVQIGFPTHSVYVDFIAGGRRLDLFLTDPGIKSEAGKPPSLFIKMIKCPNSPNPYHVGLFNQYITITSSNRDDFSIQKGDVLFGERGEISANIQRVIWADKGYIPGYGVELPMNYRNVCEVMERNAAIRKTFNCFIHREEILHILANLHTLSDLNIAKRDLFYFKHNLVELLASNLADKWITVPSFNLFENQDKMFLT